MRLKKWIAKSKIKNTTKKSNIGTKHSENMEHYKKIKLMNNRYSGRRNPGKGPMNIFNKIIEDNFPNQNKKMSFYVQKSYRTSIRQD